MSKHYEKRKEKRISLGKTQPIRALLSDQDQVCPLEVVNYHYRGARLRIKSKFTSVLDREEVKISFYLGEKEIASNIKAAVAWHKSYEGYTDFGVKFTESQDLPLDQKGWIQCNPNFLPQITAQDPMENHRELYLKLSAFDKDNFQIESSLANRHLLPGIEIQNLKIVFNNSPQVTCHLSIYKTFPSFKEDKFFLLGKVQNKSKNFDEYFNRYAVAFAEVSDENRMDFLKAHGIKNKGIKQQLSFSIVDNDEDYARVLRLRHKSYSKVGKAQKDVAIESQGEGLKNEGVIVAAKIAGEVVATLEVRWASSWDEFRSSSLFNLSQLGDFTADQCVELNKLAIDPGAQGSDVVVGMIQKAYAIIMSQGGANVFVMASSKLKKLYTRIGFNPKLAPVSHPTKEEDSLTLMFISKNALVSGEGVNAAAWDVIYDMVHSEYSKQNAVTKSSSVKLKALVGRVLNIMMAFIKKKSKKASTKKNQPHSKQSESSYIPVKLTEQHIAVKVLNSYIEVADEKLGKSMVDEILQKIGIPRSYFTNENNWLSVEFLNLFTDAFGLHGSIKDLSIEAAKKSFEKGNLGFNYYLLKQIGFRSALKIFGDFSRKFNRSRIYDIVELGADSARVRVGVPSRTMLPKHRESCLNWIQTYESSILLTTGQKGKVKKTKCCFDGDEFCEYTLEWKTGSLGSVLKNIRRFFRSREFTEMQTNFETFEQQANAKYQQLQETKELLDKRYNESKLLEQTLQEIQSTNDFNKILQVTLENVCGTFDFDRSFCMIFDKKKQVLKTALAHTSEDIKLAKDDLMMLTNFQVDVQKQRRNSMVISSVFHTGHSVMIDQVDQYLFQFNENSQNLISRLKSKGFVMVPLKGSEHNWGVLIADKITNGKPIHGEDLVLLKRIGQYLGIALDKQAKLDQQRHINRVFESYVPAEVVAKINAEEDPVLGGESRYIASMFMDIRGFTQFTSDYPPTIVLHSLNKIFAMVHDVVDRYQGNIDKFLGDGMMVTWGAVRGGAWSASTIFSAYQDICSQLDELNVDFKRNGLPKFKLGFGVHVGSAIVGNIGGLKRMEFTAIGSVVNISSRLEGLCKTYDSQIICSNDFFELLMAKEKEKFNSLNEVNVRGVNGMMKLFGVETPKDQEESSNIKLAS